jgi:hypothetical protein
MLGYVDATLEDYAVMSLETYADMPFDSTLGSVTAQVTAVAVLERVKALDALQRTRGVAALERTKAVDTL